MNNWIIESHSAVEFESVKMHIERQLQHIEKLCSNWRPTPPKQLEVPHSWILSEEELNKSLVSLFHSVKFSGDKILAGTFLHHVQDQISLITEDEIQIRYSDPESTLVDFQHQAPRSFRGENWNYYHIWATPDPLTRGTMQARFHFMGLVLWDDAGSSCSQLIGACLTGAPGCWLLNQPHLLFPSQIPGSSHIRPAFALVRNPIIPRALETKAVDKTLLVSLHHPALVIGVRGEEHLYPAQPLLGKSPVELICSSAEQSLDALVQAWRIRNRIQDVPLSMGQDVVIPPWLFTFGIICNAHSITILAFVPIFDISNPNVHYVCKTVDDIPFGAFGAPASGQSDTVPLRLLDRIRLLTAMTTISKHAFRLCDIFDAPFVWPPTSVPETNISPSPGESEARPISPVADPEERLASYELELKHWAARYDSDDEEGEGEDEDEDIYKNEDDVTVNGEIDPKQRRRIESWVHRVVPSP